MAVALTLRNLDPPWLAGDIKGFAAAFLVALALHAGALLLLAAWRSTAVVHPPGEQLITIELAPQMVEAPSVVPVETSVLAGAPAEIEAIEPPREVVTAQPLEPQQLADAKPVETTTPPPPQLANTESVPIVVVAESVLPPETEVIESTAAETFALPPAPVLPFEPPTVIAALPPPETVTARTLPDPVPQPLKPPRERVQRDPPKPTQAARPGAGGQSQRQAQGASSRENARGAAASAAANAMSRYAAQLAAALKARLRYPEVALAAGITGSATLRFTVHRSGRVLSARIVKSAGHAALDAAALAAAGSSLPPAPDGVPQQQLTISVPLRFDIR